MRSGLILGIVLLGGATAFARDSFDVEVTLLKELRQRGMPQFQKLQLRMMKQQFAGRQDDLRYLDALMQPNAAKRRQALAAIPENSPRYAEALWELSRLTSDPKAKFELLKQHWGLVSQSREVEPALVRKSAQALLGAGVRAGEDVPDPAVTLLFDSRRAQDYWRGRIRLSRADALKVAGKPATEYRKPAAAALKILTDSALLWRQDFLGTLGYIEAAHAQLLLGEPQKARDLLTPVTEMVKQLETEMRRRGQDIRTHSPMAPFRLYLAGIHVADAEKLRHQADQRQARAELLSRALRLYHSIQNDYYTSTCLTAAVAGYDRTAAILQRDFDVRITKPQDSGEKLYNIGMQYYSAEDHEAAFPYLTAAARRAETRTMAADALFYATACMYKQERFLEAHAVVDFMADLVPLEKRTADMLSKTALITLAAGRDQQDQAALYGDSARRLFERLLAVAPDHASAPYAAYCLANEMWRAADGWKYGRTDGATSGADAAKAMQQAYLDAAPAYLVVVEKYGTSKYAAPSHYRLGWIYYIAAQHEQAIKHFTEFCRLETAPAGTKLKAKGLIARIAEDQGKQRDALAHWEELLAWHGGGKYDDRDKLVQQAVHDAHARVPFCLYRLAEEKLDEATALEAEAEELEQQAGGQR